MNSPMRLHRASINTQTGLGSRKYARHDHSFASRCPTAASRSPRFAIVEHHPPASAEAVCGRRTIPRSFPADPAVSRRTWGVGPYHGDRESCAAPESFSHLPASMPLQTGAANPLAAGSRRNHPCAFVGTRAQTEFQFPWWIRDRAPRRVPCPNRPWAGQHTN